MPVFILVFDRFQLLDAAGPAQVFATSNEEEAEPSGGRYEVRLVSRTGGLVRSSSGIALETGRMPDARRLAGALVIVAGGPGVQDILGDDVIERWLRHAAARAARVCSVCTGAFALAASGILDGHAAVTHWRHLDRFAQAFPRVRLQADPIFVKSGKFHTSAGVTAGIDLCLALVEEDLGLVHALAVAKRLVVYMKRPGGQLQFSSELLSQSAPGSEFAKLAARIKADLRSSWSVQKMSDLLGVSPRTLHRQFEESLGMSPARFVALARLERACLLIEQSSASLKAIARTVGFGREENMKNAFVRRLGVTPVHYSARFRL